MKKLYWRPPGVSRTGLLLVASFAIAALIALESFPVRRKQSQYREKIAAARLARKCMDVIKATKKSLGHIAPREVDPVDSGMIGESLTPVTSNTGFLSAKLTSTNPNFAAVIVHLLARAGVVEGDVVAIGVSGSFPALNVSSYAAMQVLGVRPIIIASASSSEWGANHIDYLWLDMDHTLKSEGLVSFGVSGASYGGIDDLGIGMTAQGRTILDAAMTRNSVKPLEPKSLADSIQLRMAHYEELAGDAPIKAYINVGGGSASVGTHVGKKQFKPGLNRTPPLSKTTPDSVMLRFAKRGVPVIHISRVKLLAERYGFPYAPQVAMPLGQGSVFVAQEYNLPLAGASLVIIIAMMFGFLRWDVGVRLLRGVESREQSKTPEQMV